MDEGTRLRRLRLRNVALRDPRYGRVVLAQRYRGRHIRHLEILDDRVENLVAAITAGLDPESVIRAEELDVIGADMLDAVHRLAADRQTVAPPEYGAVHRYVARRNPREIVGRGVVCAGGNTGKPGFDRDVVVPCIYVGIGDG